MKLLQFVSPLNLLVATAKRRKRQFFWMICRIPVRPFDYVVKAGQPAHPKTSRRWPWFVCGQRKPP